MSDEELENSLETTIAIPMNDVMSPYFVSGLDPHFRLQPGENKLYEREDPVK
jgi:hypothetical protein